MCGEERENGGDHSLNGFVWFVFVCAIGWADEDLLVGKVMKSNRVWKRGRKKDREEGVGSQMK